MALLITAQVGSHMQKEGVLQTLIGSFRQQLMHQLRQHRLKGLLANHIVSNKSKNPIEIDGG